MCIVVKFSYSSFGVYFSNISWFVSYNYRIFIAYDTINNWGLIITCGYQYVLFPWRIKRIFAKTILCSEDAPSREEYASQFKALFNHFLFMSILSSCVLELFGKMPVRCFSSPIWNLIFSHSNCFQMKNRLDIHRFCLPCCASKIYYFRLCLLSIRSQPNNQHTSKLIFLFVW